MQLLAHCFENFQAGVHAKAALGISRRAIGFVERTFVNEWNTQARANFFELARHVHRHVQALYRASASNQKERLV